MENKIILYQGNIRDPKTHQLLGVYTVPDPVTIVPDDRKTAIEGLTDIQNAIKESMQLEMTAKQTQQWVMFLVNETLGKLGADTLTPDNFDDLMGGTS